MTATTGDEKIARLLGEGGQAGLARYGLYWLVNEIIASQMEGPDPSCSVCYPVSVWSHKLLTRGSLVFSALSRLPVTVERDGDDIRVTNRNLLKYRDEYARKSGHTPEQLPARTEGEGELKEESTLKAKAKTIAVTSSEVPASASPGVYFLPLPRDQRHEVTEADVEVYQECYPGVDVYAELGKMKGWLLANPQKAKTARGIKAFIANWLGKAQNTHSGGKNGNSNDRINEIARTGQGALDILASLGTGPDQRNGSAQTRPGSGRVLESAPDSLVEPHRGRNR